MVILFLTGCLATLQTQPCAESFGSPGAYTCDVPGWDDRAYDLVLPSGYSADDPVPLVLALHGGGGNRVGQARTTCPGGDIDDPGCLHALADREGFAVVYPDGNPGPGLKRNLRVWAAGGGVDDWRCASGHTCEEGLDDIPYFDDLLDDIESRAAIDTTRIYSTGLSNGGSMSHRLACELSDRIAAVAPIGGANQFTTSGTCAPERAVPVMHVHGTADPCWVYEGGETECPTGQKGLKHVSVQRTLDEWADLQSCDPEPTETALPDTEDDGTTSTRLTWSGCDAALEHVRIEGGGHTWPDGHQYLGVKTVGPVPTDFDSQLLWDFFQQHELTP